MNGASKQILITFLLSVLTFMLAVGNTWPSYTLPLLESDDSPIGYKITKNDGILIGSLVMLGSLASLLIAGYTVDKIGRKRTEILCGLCYALAWSIIGTATNVTHILVGRFIIGVGTGLHFVAGIIFTSEISQPALKGTLMSIIAFMHNVGALVSYLEGWFCSYDVINYLSLTIVVGFLLISSYYIQETPIYLLKIGKEKEALNSLMFYRGASKETQDVLDEFIYMKSQLKYDNRISEFDNSDLKSQKFYETEKMQKENEIAINAKISEPTGFWSKYGVSKSSQRSLVILVMNMTLSLSMGMIAVQVYAGQFFTQAVPSLSPHLCSVLLAIVMALASGLSVFVTDLFPRRVLMISSCIISAMCMWWTASTLRWSWAPDWATPLAMVFYCIAYQVGVINIPFVQITECLPPQMNSFGSSVTMCSIFLTNFIILFIFKPAVDYFGLDIVFLTFGVMGLITAAVSYLFMRETRHVPFETTLNTFEDGYLYRRRNLKEYNYNKC